MVSVTFIANTAANNLLNAGSYVRLELCQFPYDSQNPDYKECCQTDPMTDISAGNYNTKKSEYLGKFL